MKLELKDKIGQDLNIGDRVKILVISDDSGMASDLFGVEPHLDGWVSSVYFEYREGIISFNKERLIYEILDGKVSFPLSSKLRSYSLDSKWEQISDEDIKEFRKEECIDEEDFYDYVLNYLEKIN